MSSPFQKLTAATAHNADTSETPSGDLSQLKPSPAFIQVFDIKPYRPDPGQTRLAMLGLQMAYQQLIRDWEPVELVLAPEPIAKVLRDFSYGIGEARVFTSGQRPGLWCRFPGILPRRYDISELDGWGGVGKVLVDAQALYIEHVGSLPDDKLYPHPRLRSLNDAKRALEIGESAE